MSRVLRIGDRHAPFTHPNYLEFIQDTKRRFRCDMIIDSGDEWDNCALSRFEQDPDGMSAGDEYKSALEASKPWYKAFPNLLLLESNHGLRPFKKAYSAGIPRAYMRTYQEFMKAPKGWTWHPQLIVDGVLHIHGEPHNGQMAAINAAKTRRMSTAIGHVHAFGGVMYSKTDKDEIFGANVGCGIDVGAYAFKYGEHHPAKPTLGCGVFIDGKEALYIPMGS